MDDLRIKQGEGLRLAIVFYRDDGSIPDLSAATITAMVRDSLDNLVATATVTPTAGAPGQYGLYVADTAAWPIGRLVADIMVADGGGDADLSQTFAIRVDRAITRAAGAGA